MNEAIDTQVVKEAKKILKESGDNLSFKHGIQLTCEVMNLSLGSNKITQRVLTNLLKEKMSSLGMRMAEKSYK